MNARSIHRSVGRGLGWLALLAIVLIMLAWVFIPAWLIQPFKEQTAGGLELSYALRRWSPVVTVIGLLSALALVVWLWLGAGRWWRKTALVAALVPIVAAAWLSRQNHFEWMFAPLPRVASATVAEVDFVADEEMVLAVEVNGEAAAYPIRQMAYHHVVPDTVGGVPVVATY
ncbi:MAG: DUF3179 domain-containing protein [Pyrinomonadaceae bacterium]|nr:DUF3179 domain-containing protein [Pyrinomonadaceae bacterium]